MVWKNRGRCLLTSTKYHRNRSACAVENHETGKTRRDYCRHPPAATRLPPPTSAVHLNLLGVRFTCPTLQREVAAREQCTPRVEDTHHADACTRSVLAGCRRRFELMISLSCLAFDAMNESDREDLRHQLAGNGPAACAPREQHRFGSIPRKLANEVMYSRVPHE